jgi:hypothetical protein
MFVLSPVANRRKHMQKPTTRQAKPKDRLVLGCPAVTPMITPTLNPAPILVINAFKMIKFIVVPILLSYYDHIVTMDSLRSVTVT